MLDIESRKKYSGHKVPYDNLLFCLVVGYVH